MNPSSVRFSFHALEKMEGRRLTMADIRGLLATTTPFPYFHRNQVHSGYYDKEQDIFVGVGNGIVTTVIVGPKAGYMDQLKERK